jgi:hypothetical protein
MAANVLCGARESTLERERTQATLEREEIEVRV